ncbi:MAG: tetratricopeptide repeat protein, partial [Ghiorsea sp.]
MQGMFRHLFQVIKYTGVAGVGLALALNTAQAAAPTLVNSLSAAQFPGIEADSLSSLYVKDGVLWITDETGLIHKWKAGERSSSFITDTEDRRFSSVILISKHHLLATDVRSGQLVLGRNGVWKVFSESGSNEGEVKQPVASAWSENGLIYVAEAGNKRISVFSDTGLFLFTFGDSDALPAMNLGEVQDIGIDRTGRVYVLDDTQGGRITVFSPLGEKLAEIGQGELISLLEVTVRITAMTVRADGIVIIADQKNGRIFEIDWESMDLLSSFGTTGRGRGQFQRVTSMALGDDGLLYIADKGNEKIEIFKLDWHQPSWIKRDADMLSIYPSSVLKSACDISYIYAAEQMLCLSKSEDTVDFRSHDGVVLKALVAKFDDPVRAVFDAKEMFVLDDAGVKVFDSNGEWKFEFASSGSRAGELADASGLALTKSAVFIADTGNARVQKFSRNGLFQKVIGKKGELKEPVAVAVDQRGNIYVADKELGKVLVYSPKGSLVTSLGADKESIHGFQQIYDLHIDKEGVLYVMASMGNNELSVWMYQDSELLYRFSPTKQEAQAGFDKQWLTIFKAKKDSTVNDIAKSAESALNSVVDLTLGTAIDLFQGGGFFSQQDWAFNSVPNNPSLIALVDLGNHARHTFTILRVPKQVREVRVSGDVETVHLNWLATSKDFSGYYTVYGRKDISSPFEVIEETSKTGLSMTRKQFDPTEYRISAMSALGKEGKLSAVYQDEFWVGYLAFQSGHFDKALTMLNQATVTNPKHASAWLYLGQTQMALAEYDDAMDTFKQLYQFKQLKGDAYHWQAKALIEKKAWLDVKALVDQAEEDGNTDAM